MRWRTRRTPADLAGGTTTSALERPVPMARRRPPGPAEHPHVGLEVVRLSVLLVATVLLQTTITPNIRILGANPDFMLVIVAAVGLLRGAEIGALFGFAGGALVALALFQPPGVVALALIIVGYLAGRYAETSDLSSGLAPLITVFAASIVASVVLTVAQFLLGREAPVWFVATRVILPVTVLNTLLAAPIFIVTKWWLGGRVERSSEVD